MSRKALVVGIDDYENAPLTGCVADAVKMETALSTNGDGSANFSVERLSSDADEVDKPTLRAKIERLFSGESDVEIALFYFSGHGVVTATGGVIVTQDARRFDEGISMSDIVRIANASNAQNKVIILDCCYSGNVGSAETGDPSGSIVGKGITIMTASLDTEVAEEVRNEGGLFTMYVIEGLQGGAADVRGRITPASLYSYVDEAMGDWEQRPVFKSNIHRFVRLKQVEASVSDDILRKLPLYFNDPSEEHQLDPSYEPERNGNEPEGTPPPDPDKNIIFADLQKLVAASLVVPVGEKHMWHAAMHSKSCRLTAVGAQYWRMAKRGI